VPTKEIWAVLKTRRPSWLPWRERPVLRTDFLEADVRSIELVCRRHGFLDAHADYQLAASRDDRSVIVTFKVDEGPRSTVRTIEIQGASAFTPDALRRRIYLKVGRPFNPSAMVIDTARISAAYKERGMLPHVGGVARRDSLDVTVLYEVNEGPVYRNGQVYLSTAGAPHVDEKLIRRELLLKPGDLFRASRVQRSVERLYETGLFSQASIAPLPDSTNTLVEYDLRVRERKPRWIDAGVGSGTSERFRFTGEWGHRNLRGQGLQGVLAARLAFDGKARFLVSRAELSLLEPWLLRSRTRGLISVYAENRHDRADTGTVLKQRPLGVRFQLRRELGRWARIALTQENIWMTQDLEVLDTARVITPLPRTYLTRRVLLAFDRDTRDDPINPGRGSSQSVGGEIAGGPLAGASSFNKGQITSTWYTPVSRSWVLATRVQAGAIDPFGDKTFSAATNIDPQVARVPVEDRFRIGGVNTLRGYDENTLPGSGGLAMFLANAELRVPLAGPFGLELFVDAGNVWPRPAYIKAKQFVPRAGNKRLDSGDLRYHFGVGGRLQLPFGPLRVDFTWSPRPDEAGEWRVARTQFAIGPSF
jgi:outer membrane protein insertion porin family